MVIVQPDPIYIIVPEGVAKSVHAITAVARMRGTETLPAIGRRADRAVGSDGGRVGMILQITGLMQRVKLGEDPRSLAFKQRDVRRVQAACADPDRIDPVVAQGTPLFKPRGRDTSVKSTYANVRARLRFRLHIFQNNVLPFLPLRTPNHTSPQPSPSQGEGAEALITPPCEGGSQGEGVELPVRARPPVVTRGCLNARFW